MIRRNKESTWIDNVPVLLLGMQKDMANVGAFEAVLSVTENPYNYADLMAISSIGLTVKWFQGDHEHIWGGDSLPGDCDDEINLISKAVSYECIIKKDKEKKNEYKKFIVETIENGIPAICLDKGLNLAVIFGYEDNGDILLVRPYIDSCADMIDWDATVRYSFENLHPYFIILNKLDAQTDRLSAIISGIQAGISNYHKKPLKSTGNYYSQGIYYYGDEAYDRWINDLLSIHSFTPEEQASLKFFSWWNSICLMNRRTTMVTVLRNLAGNPYKTQTTKAYIEAAKLCTQQVSILERMTKDNSYNTESAKWIEQISNDIHDLKLLSEIEKKLYDLLSGISDYKDI